MHRSVAEKQAEMKTYKNNDDNSSLSEKVGLLELN